VTTVPRTPFDSVENAHEYVRLLVETILEAQCDIEADIAAMTRPGAERRLEALRLVRFKLDKLEQHLRGSARILNDLRTLRRHLLAEREKPAPGNGPPTGTK
jgi:hypothetical protein